MSRTNTILTKWKTTLLTLPSCVHRDERGAISIASVFAVLMFTMLMVMNINFATHVDDKLKMQSAADASAYSGGVILARGMNGIAFSNHLLCDVFAMTAFLREADQRNAEQITPQILDAWEEAGNTLAGAPFPKFQGLGQAIIRKVPMERELVDSWAEMSFASAELSLDVFEHILEQRLIPNFQREALRSVPELAQQVTNEVARQHGHGRIQGLVEARPTNLDRPRGEQVGVMWQTKVLAVGTDVEFNPLQRTLPVIDPDPEQSDYMNVPYGDEYFETAVAQRRQLSNHYLNLWNFDRLSFFRSQGKMSTYFHLWRIATCGQLSQLLDIEYPRTNLPMVIRRMEDGRDLEAELRRLERQLEMSRRNYRHHPILMNQLRQEVQLDDHLENNFQFVNVVYRKHQREFGPGMFKNPLRENQDALAFSQVSLFVPQARMRQHHRGEGGGGGGQSVPLGGTFGYASDLDLPAQSPPVQAIPFDPNDAERANREFWALENWPTHWDLLNQNWMVQLVPANAHSVQQVLRSAPITEFDFELPEFYFTSEDEFRTLNNH